MQEETRRFSIALIRCCGESKCQGAPGPCPPPPSLPSTLSPPSSPLPSPAHPFYFPLISIFVSPPSPASPPPHHHHSPPSVQLKVGLALPQRPPSLPSPPSLPAPPHHHHHFFSLCQTNLQLLLVHLYVSCQGALPTSPQPHCSPPPTTTISAPATFSFSFLSTSIMALKCLQFIF